MHYIIFGAWVAAITLLATTVAPALVKLLLLIAITVAAYGILVDIDEKKRRERGQS